MRLRVPSYYKEFRCIADRCQDSCCIGWEIDIDEDTFSYYKSVEGAFGERLRSHMVSEDVNSFTLKENGWCPFLNSKKLCDICIELGEEALLAMAMDDKIHQPYRRSLIADYGIIEDMCKNKGAAFCLSGAGPTLLCVTRSDSLAAYLKQQLPSVTQANWTVLELEADHKGVQIL